jgi:TfoX/Sxy family transcriptional regulator of competence genes
MAYDENLADRIRMTLHEKGIKFQEKKMMGGLTFMVQDKMCVGIVKNDLMARIGKENDEMALRKPGCRVMDFTGKPMKGYVFVDPSAIDMDSELDYWIELCIEFNKTLKA